MDKTRDLHQQLPTRRGDRDCVKETSVQVKKKTSPDEGEPAPKTPSPIIYPKEGRTIRVRERKGKEGVFTQPQHSSDSERREDKGHH